MTEQEIEELVEKELATFSYADEIDIQCFKSHRVKPSQIKLSLDEQGEKWTTCYLITDHNGKDDSPYRVVYDPDNEKFGKEVTLENDIPLYLGRYPDLESLIDGFA